MPKNLTGVSQWATVAVPVDTEPADGASVEVSFQALADRTRLLFNHLMSMLLYTWLYLEHNSFTAWINGGAPLQARPHDICHDSSADWFTAIDNLGVTVISTDPGVYSAAADAPGGQGELWAEESVAPDTVLSLTTPTSCEVAAYSGTRVVVNDGNTVGYIAESSAVGVWNSRITADGNAWHCVDHDGAGLWAIGGSGGKLNTSANRTAWTSRSSGASDTIRLMRHNRLSGGAALWLALSDTKACWSADGVTWSNATHSLTSIPLRLDYDADADIWMALLDNGALAESDDDGATWSETADPFGLAAAATLLKYEVGLASNRESGWVATYERYTGTHPTVATITSKRWVSKDGGATWDRVYSTDMTGVQRGGVCYGADRFATCGDNGANYSLRAVNS